MQQAQNSALERAINELFQFNGFATECGLNHRGAVKFNKNLTIGIGKEGGCEHMLYS
jgi:hypothetical protein